MLPIHLWHKLMFGLKYVKDAYSAFQNSHYKIGIHVKPSLQFLSVVFIYRILFCFLLKDDYTFKKT